MRIAAVDLVAGDPRRGDAGIKSSGDHLGGQCGLGRERQVVGDACRAAPIGVLGPGARDVEAAVDGGVPGRTRVDEVYGDLGVLDPARGSGVLALDPDARGALLQVPGLVNNQYGALVSEVLDYEVPYLVADFVGIPAGPAEKVLHAGRTGVTGVLGDRPAVLPRQVHEQPQHEHPRPAARFHPGEPARHLAHQAIEYRLPPGKVYAVAHGHRLIFDCRHNSR
ncbi:hypothetical protein QF030_000620 [Streptomyces rishiriensis]|uniref:Uncharacterized protein n=1 Tax=Streptomyces rishiriensis TaxID=68264 RepID=A0ABU0NII7_STRRH|nr:hypothetical protein [Streptomyces rishiriensis]